MNPTKLTKVAGLVCLTVIAGWLAFGGIGVVGAAVRDGVADQHLTLIKNRGDAEINRRLAKLNKLSDAINGAKRLNANDKSTLSSEVNDEINGLTALKAKLDADTDLPTARIDSQSIFTEYRVYALVAPKVWLVRVADNQQVVEDKLNTLIGKFQTRLNAASSQGKNVTALQQALNEITTKTTAAQAISSSVEQKVLPLQPTDYNADHNLLSGYLSSLHTAHNDLQAAYQAAQTITQGLKTL